jgi:hypothetical protein
MRCTGLAICDHALEFKCERVSTCGQCYAVYVVKYFRNSSVFCSKACHFRSMKLKGISTQWRHCQNCFNFFIRRDKGDADKYCSRSCHKYVREPISSAIYYLSCRGKCGSVTVKRTNQRKTFICEPCGKLANGKRNLQRNIEKHNLNTSERECKECSVKFVSVYGTKRRLYCSLTCSRRHGKRKTKATRRALMKGVEVQPFNPIEVLERDGWKCYICGIDTPRILRGTNDSSAPELEHIVALSNGGAHTMDNTACACRQCNGLKAANDNYIPSRIAA